MVPAAADRAGGRRPRGPFGAWHAQGRRSRDRGGDAGQGDRGALPRRRAEGGGAHRHRAQGQGAGLCGGRPGGDPPLRRHRGEARAAAGRRRHLGAGQSGIWSAASRGRYCGGHEGCGRGSGCRQADPPGAQGAEQVTGEEVEFEIRPITDRAFLEDLLRLRWSGGALMLRGKIVHPKDVEALAAYHDGRLVGVATWRLEGPVMYLVTLNNISDQRGVGLVLLDAMKTFGREKGSALLRVIVTNDNLNAPGFYQRRGFRIIAVHTGAIDVIRGMMPHIPEMGANRIPIRDEIELEIAL